LDVSLETSKKINKERTEPFSELTEKVSETV
jgi:hypothetical protein